MMCRIGATFVSYGVTILALVLSLSAQAVGDNTALPDLRSDQCPTNAIWLDSLNLWHTVLGDGKPRAGTSFKKHPITLNGVVYKRGLGTHAYSELHVALAGDAVRFLAMVGVDDEVAPKGSVRFAVEVDGTKAIQTDILHGGDPGKLIDVDLTGAKRLTLLVYDAGDGIDLDHADWAGAMILLAPNAKHQPRTVSAASDAPSMKIASGVPPEPRINNPRIVGTTPGRPFLFRIPASGQRPLEYAAENLPSGLDLDSKTGMITGSLAEAGKFRTKITVKGPKGTDSRELTIVGGQHKLALTPPMGWNSWNAWLRFIDDAKIRAAADAMVKSGLADHGYQYINVDDCWQGDRDANGEIQPNDKFPDMKALGDYIHAKGLKFGIYSSPGPQTCCRFEGSYQHEEQDAKTWAHWGVDYVKYDWCMYRLIADTQSDVPKLQKPYRLMRAALDKVDRDIVYSLCQYGMGDVWKWGAEVGGNLWRTSRDIKDYWPLLHKNGFVGMSERSPYAGPGHWNDPDMLVVGKVFLGRHQHDSNLTPNEQITHITLWSLLAAPLLLGCDLTQLDQFTLDLLTNDEVLDVDQDPLGRAAIRKAQSKNTEIWSRPLADGTLAVGLFNTGPSTAQVTAKWSDLGITGPHKVRDLWLRTDVGSFDNAYTCQIHGHGAVLIKISKS